MTVKPTAEINIHTLRRKAWDERISFLQPLLQRLYICFLRVQEMLNLAGSDTHDELR